MKKVKCSLSVLLFLGLFVLMASSAFALKIQPVRYEFDVDPGEHYDIEYTVGKDEILDEDLQYVAEIVGTKLDENGKKSMLEGEDMTNEPFYSVSDWVAGNKFYAEKAENGYNITIPVDVPEDTAAGTYYFYTIIHTENPDEDEATFDVQARVASPVILTILGEEVDEDLELNSFELNSDGELQFVANFTNNSSVQLAPIGKITIFNKDGEQVQDIVTVTKELPDGSKAIESVKNDIYFNFKGQKIAPNITTSVAEPWKNRTISPGEYTAKLEGTFGRSGSFTAETEFEISENFEISEFETSMIQMGLPVYFDIKLRNNGDLPVTAKANLVIKGLFGDTVYKETVSTQAIKAGEVFKIDNLEWSSGFAFGYYTADLEITDSSGKIILESTSFIVANIWGILITIVILALIIFFIMKYRKLQAKLAIQKGKSQSE